MDFKQTLRRMKMTIVSLSGNSLVSKHYRNISVLQLIIEKHNGNVILFPHKYLNRMETHPWYKPRQTQSPWTQTHLKLLLLTSPAQPQPPPEIHPTSGLHSCSPGLNIWSTFRRNTVSDTVLRSPKWIACFPPLGWRSDETSPVHTVSGLDHFSLLYAGLSAICFKLILFFSEYLNWCISQKWQLKYIALLYYVSALFFPLPLLNFSAFQFFPFPRGFVWKQHMPFVSQAAKHGVNTISSLSFRFVI